MLKKILPLDAPPILNIEQKGMDETSYTPIESMG
jgi:hypothetical protein